MKDAWGMHHILPQYWSWAEACIQSVQSPDRCLSGALNCWAPPCSRLCPDRNHAVQQLLATVSAGRWGSSTACAIPPRWDPPVARLRLSVHVPSSWIAQTAFCGCKVTGFGTATCSLSSRQACQAHLVQEKGLAGAHNHLPSGDALLLATADALNHVGAHYGVHADLHQQWKWVYSKGQTGSVTPRWSTGSAASSELDQTCHDAVVSQAWQPLWDAYQCTEPAALKLHTTLTSTILTQSLPQLSLLPQLNLCRAR